VRVAAIRGDKNVFDGVSTLQDVCWRTNCTVDTMAC